MDPEVDEEEEDGEEVVQDPEEEFVEAAEAGDLVRVRALLDQGVNIKTRDAEGMSAMDMACREGHVEVAALLLDRGSNVNAMLYRLGDCPILEASRSGHLDVVKLLHARGGDIHKTSRSGKNALHAAAEWDHMHVCEFLLSKGADLMAETGSGRTALCLYGNDVDICPDYKAARCSALLVAHIAYWREREATLNSTVKARDDEISRLKETPASLLFSDAFSDLVFVCPGGERIHSHRNIVSACSPHARVLLQGPWAENADERVAVVQMPQSAAAVRALLRFLYTGEVDAAAIETSMSDVLDLASQHEQPLLTAACERHAIAALSLSTVVPVLSSTAQKMPWLFPCPRHLQGSRRRTRCCGAS